MHSKLVLQVHLLKRRRVDNWESVFSWPSWRILRHQELWEHCAGGAWRHFEGSFTRYPASGR